MADAPTAADPVGGEDRVAALEAALHAAEHRATEAREDARRSAEALSEAQEQNRGLMEQLKAATATVAAQTAPTVAAPSNSEQQPPPSSDASSAHSAAVLRTHLDAEVSKVSKLVAALEESRYAQQALESAHRLTVQELDSLRAQHLVLAERAREMDKNRREFAERLSEEELAAMSWKGKADLYLGDYTRLTSRLRDLELAAAESKRDRRLALRIVAQQRSLLKRLVVRTFVRATRTRKMLFAIFARVNQVSATRLEMDATAHPAASSSAFTSSPSSSSSSMSPSPSPSSTSFSVSGGVRFASVGDGFDVLDAIDRFGGAASTLSGGVEASQAVSLRQFRQERAKLQAFLVADRTPISRLLALLTDELAAFESPFHALQAENAQLRATLDAFFRRNIQLMSQFLTAKTTYEALHAEYKRCRESWENMKRRENAANANANANASGTAGDGTNAFDPQHEEDDGASSSFAPSLLSSSTTSPASTAPGVHSRGGGQQPAAAAAAFYSNAAVFNTASTPEAYAALTNMTLSNHTTVRGVGGAGGASGGHTATTTTMPPLMASVAAAISSRPPQPASRLAQSPVPPSNYFSPSSSAGATATAAAAASSVSPRANRAIFSNGSAGPGLRSTHPNGHMHAQQHHQYFQQFQQPGAAPPSSAYAGFSPPFSSSSSPYQTAPNDLSARSQMLREKIAASLSGHHTSSPQSPVIMTRPASRGGIGASGILRSPSPFASSPYSYGGGSDGSSPTYGHPFSSHQQSPYDDRQQSQWPQQPQQQQQTASRPSTSHGSPSEEKMQPSYTRPPIASYGTPLVHHRSVPAATSSGRAISYDESSAAHFADPPRPAQQQRTAHSARAVTAPSYDALFR